MGVNRQKSRIHPPSDAGIFFFIRRNEAKVRIEPILIFLRARYRGGRRQTTPGVEYAVISWRQRNTLQSAEIGSRSITMFPATVAPAAIEFGRFRVLSHRRELLAGNRPVELGGRAFDVLMALIEARGAVVSKDTLLERVWPDRIVEENNLQFQISTLRKALAVDRDLIRTVTGRGYQFIGEIRSVSTGPDVPTAAAIPEATPTPSRPLTNLPQPISELIGRDAQLGEILDLSASHRLVTLTGAGGIGKTRLGFEVARHQLPKFADGVWAVELAPLSDPDLVPAAVATTLGLELASGTASPQSVADALRSKQLMLVLDNCEHVIDAAARMSEALLRANPAACVIATSREPLRAEGEWVYRVSPLAVPPEDSPDTEDPLRYGAVLLFRERARAAAPNFSPDARMAAAIAGICRRLDRIPLAIELAAARAAALGLEGLAACRVTLTRPGRFAHVVGGFLTWRQSPDWVYGRGRSETTHRPNNLTVQWAPFHGDPGHRRAIVDTPIQKSCRRHLTVCSLAEVRVS
jgi:DNA-binding winged helix-turn-helix (wHTH) protein